MPPRDDERERRMLPFVREFAKFVAGFAILISLALLLLNATGVFAG